MQGDGTDKESEHHDETVSDIAARSPAFLNRMQNFKKEFEKIKVCIVYTCTAHMQ